MSTLISSAVSGKKAAPKAAPRRRAPPPPGGKQSTPLSVSSTHTSVAPPSPPPTQPAQPGPSQPTETPPPPTSPNQSRSQSQQVEPTQAPTAPAPTSSEQPSDQDGDLPPAESFKKRRADGAAAKVPTKRVKRNSARSNATVQAQVNDESGPYRMPLDPRLQEPEPVVSASPAPSATAQKPKKARKPRRKKTTTAESGTEDEGAQHDLELLEQQLAAAKSKRRRKTKKSRRKEAESEAGTDTQQATDGEQQEDSSSSDAESDPELHEIDAEKLTMLELSRDKKHGQTSERERKMAQIDWHEVARRRREEIDIVQTAAQEPPPNEEVRETTEGPSGTAEPAQPAAPEAPPPPEGTATVGGVKFRVINGVIVEDEQSLNIDRRAQAAEEAEDEAPVEEENDLTKRINRTTWLHSRRRNPEDRVPVAKRKSDPWTEDLTDRFYDALAMFGTDFYIISNLFPGKNRRHIKHKFSREEKLDPKRINDALLGRHKPRQLNAPSLSLDYYARETGQDRSAFEKYRDAEHAEEVIRESMREKEKEMREAIREQEEEEAAAKEAQVEKANRKRGEGKEGKGSRGGRGGGRGGRKKKAGGGFGGGGGPEGGEGGE